MRRFIVCLAVCWAVIFMASVASCDDSASIRREIAIQSLAAAVDLGSTEWCLNQGGLREGNPMMQRAAARYALKAALVVGVSGITHKLERQGKKRTARAVRWTVVGVQVAAGAWNVRQGLRERQR